MGRLIGLRYRYFGVGIVESLIISQDGRIVISSGDKMDVSVSARLLTENLAFSSLYIFRLSKVTRREPCVFVLIYIHENQQQGIQTYHPTHNIRR